MVSLNQDDLIPIQLVSMELCYQDAEVNFQMRELKYGKKSQLSAKKAIQRVGWVKDGSTRFPSLS